MYDIILTRFLRYSDIVKKVWYHVWYHMFFMISYMISYFWQYHTRFLRYFFVILPTISYTYHTKCAMISECYDITHDFGHDMTWFGPLISVFWYIIAMWYHGFHDMFAYIMAPARRDGAGWGRQGPGAPPPPASPSPTCCGRVFSWTATVLIPRMDLLHRLLRA